MQKLRAIWRREPGDGTGCSIADGEARNAKGLCISCDNPMNPNSKWRPGGGVLCNECDAAWDENMRKFINAE